MVILKNKGKHTMLGKISTTDDTLDSRDIIHFIDDFEEMFYLDMIEDKTDIECFIDNAMDDNPDSEYTENWKQALESEFYADYIIWRTLEHDLENETSEWNDGLQLINSDYWTNYCDELLDDTGFIPKDLPDLIKGNINWDGIYNDLKQDYTYVSIAGSNYYYRNC